MTSSRSSKFILILIICVILTIGMLLLFRPQISKLTNNISSQNAILSLNLDQSLYQPGDTVNFYITSLDESGTPLCQGSLELTITTDNQTVTTLATAPAGTDKSPTGAGVTIATASSNTRLNPVLPGIPTTFACINNPTGSEPTHTAIFKPTAPGTYKVILKNLYTKASLNQSFEVVSSNPEALLVTRASPSHLKVGERYPMVITIKAVKDITGTITDTLPNKSEFVWYGKAKIRSNTISWTITLKAGESTDLKYEYRLREPGSATIGPLKTTFGTLENSTWNLIVSN